MFAVDSLLIIEILFQFQGINNVVEMVMSVEKVNNRN